MRINSKIILLSLCFFFAGVPGMKAQEKAEIEGLVVEAGEKGIPMDYAAVSIMPAELHTVTDENGEFRFSGLKAGTEVNIKVQFVGYKTIDTLVTLSSVKTNRYVFRMEMENFFMDEVTVTATVNKAGEATASQINRQAIDHMQASSLKDVMQLIPGGVMSNSNLANPNLLSIRSIGDDALNSMGTALILDGAQQSNNANLQMGSSAATGSTSSPIYYQSASAGNSTAGIDTRTVSLDNVESVEVIRGIPSAEYGDLTSGAVIVKSKVGQTPVNVKLSARPEQYQGSVSKGLRLGEKGGTLNLNADVLYTIKRPIESYWNYRRITAGGIWAKRWSDNFDTRTSLNLHYGLDKRSANPDNAASQLQESGRDMGLRFNTTGNININRGWLQSVEYGVSASYVDKLSDHSELSSNVSGIYSTNMVSGSTVSNWAGRPIYDKDGNQITGMMPGSENAFVDFMKDTRTTRTQVFGKEISANARVKATLYKDWNNGIRNKIIAGAEFKTDGNRGKGRVYENETAPGPSSGYAGERIRHYYDIPFMNQASVYAEDLYRHSFASHELTVSAGARFDWVNGKSVLAPRANASLTLFDRVTLRGGYGITAKAPALAYLYPDNAYFDMPLYSYVSGNDKEKLVIVRTDIYSTENRDLKIATNNKAEAGFDIRLWKNRRLSVTGYIEKIKNGYSFDRGLDDFHLVNLPVYKLVSEVPGDIPAIQLENTYKVWQSYYTPGNAALRNKHGVEFELDLGRFESIRTSFNLSGAWMKESSGSNAYSYSESIRTGPGGTEMERNIGVYEKNRVVNWRERLVTTLRITHNIPRIGFVVTLTGQLTALDKAWSKYSTDMFCKYLSRFDGKAYDFDPAKAEDPEFSYLFPTHIPENREWVEKAIPTLFFNLTLTKEIGKSMRISFFANNMFYDRPIYNSTKNSKSLIELGNDIFFGFDLTFSIK